MALPPLPSPFHERLLPTAADAVDAATAEAIQAFCEASPEVEAAYVCVTERTREGAQPERALRLSVNLLSPVDTQTTLVRHHWNSFSGSRARIRS
jgi:hypothetical protein